MSARWLAVLGFHVLLAQSTSSAALDVRVEGVRNGRGRLQLLLFAQAEGFPDRPVRATRVLSLAPQDPLDVRVTDLEPGTYALSALHDENENGRLDVGWFGIPLEGVAASNDAARGGRPRFEDARFQVPPQGRAVTLRLRYWR